MFAYLIKRLLLLIPTLIGVVTLTFVVIQFVPGGPIEQMMMEMKGRGLSLIHISEPTRPY